MKYQLKDKKALEQISTLCPSFPDKLQDACERELDDDGVEVTIYIRLEDLEITETYKPNEWNDYPGVTPPRNELLRCENIDEKGRVSHYCATFDGRYWYKDGNSMAMGTMCDTKAPNRFRAWE